MNEAAMDQLSRLAGWDQDLPSEWRFCCPSCGDEGWLERNPKLNMIGCFSGCHPALICYHTGLTLADIFPQGNTLARDVYCGLIKTAIADGVRVFPEDRERYLQLIRRASMQEAA